MKLIITTIIKTKLAAVMRSVFTKLQRNENQIIGKTNLDLVGNGKVESNIRTAQSETLIIDSKVVNAKIRNTIKPLLIRKGFTLSTARTFWRHTESCIYVVNFQSFNTSLASSLNVTTFSYAVNIGIYIKGIDYGHPIKNKNGLELPQEFHCHLRGRIKPSITQKTPNKDIWHIYSDASNLDSCIDDAFKQIDRNLDSWFESVNTIHKIISVIEDGKEDMNSIWGWGNNPSPNRSLLLAILYFPTNRTKSESFLEEVVKGPSYKNLFKTKDEGLQYLECHFT